MTPIFSNSAFVRAPEALLKRGGAWRAVNLQVRYGLIRHASGPILIDTGYTAESITAPGRSFGLRIYGQLLRPRLIATGQPQAFLARQGLRPQDITRVIVTHFHADHISGLRQFPNARFTASARAYARIRQRSTAGNLRHGIFPDLLPDDFAARLDPIEHQAEGPSGRDLLGDGSLFTIDLPGHAEEHFGLYFPQATGGPLAYGTDAQWLIAALEPSKIPGPPLRWIAESPAALAPSSARLTALRDTGARLMLCHDPALTAFDEVLP
ncbi:MBL fold metallo-hydrolase [Xinfangfangia sp. CPCC 101601]|uniref:MBL fold metallo-hydrolase n=1 Tax=Pseudogemmobacter lacusdianii TaxID=3069608 RepID=A0ABU0W1G6_9RHOB|nr:MBL fold metallo-hydrolase [Xinfangfangia sp. CPCC 101601]MDQ2067832.1 MBL fold metallo-hydrolase [Xinfangfangia sp. CPCC 101601]